MLPDGVLVGWLLSLWEVLQDQRVNQGLLSRIIFLYMGTQSMRDLAWLALSVESVSYSPLPHASPAGFQNQTFWKPVFPVQNTPGWEA